MPNLEDFESEDEWMAACVPERIEEGDDQEQAVAVCLSMWREKDDVPDGEEDGDEGNGKRRDDGREYKTLPFELTELDIEGRTIEGYAATFGNTDLGGDVIHRGAFKKTLAERGNKVRFLWQHDSWEPLGKPLEMREDERGLFVKAAVSDTQRGRDALALLRDGAIDGLSIGYDAIETDISKDAEGDTVRNLREIRLWEFSLVTFPMNEIAQITALKGNTGPENADTKDIDDLLAQKQEAMIEAARAWLEAAEAQRDADQDDDEPNDDEPKDDTAPADEDAGRDEDADGAGAEPPQALTPEQEARRQELMEQIQQELEV